jgi:hypothetical protein
MVLLNTSDVSVKVVYETILKDPAADSHSHHLDPIHRREGMFYFFRVPLTLTLLITTQSLHHIPRL